MRRVPADWLQWADGNPGDYSDYAPGFRPPPKGEISPYDLEVMVLKDGTLPNLRRSGLRLLAEGQTDLKAVSKTIDMTYSDE